MPENRDQKVLHIVVAAATGFAVSFEEAAAALEQIDRLYFEPDGSFVWARESWQIDGVLYDRDGRVQHLEIKGTAPPQALDRLLATVGWPATELSFELVREGCVLDEAKFREWLS